MDVTKRLKNLVISLSNNKHTLNDIDKFVFNLEYKEKKKLSLLNSKQKLSPPTKQRAEVLPEDVVKKKKTKKKDKYDPNLFALLEIQRQKFKIVWKKLDSQENELNKQLDDLEQRLKNTQSRFAIAELILDSPIMDIEPAKEKIKQLEAFNIEMNPEEPIKLYQDVLNEKMEVELLETQNMNRRLLLEERRDNFIPSAINDGLSISFSNFNPMHPNESFELDENQLRRKDKLLKAYDDIEELIKRNMKERERIENDYKRKTKQANELSKEESTINSLFVQVHSTQESLDYIDDKYKTLSAQHSTAERSQKTSLLMESSILEEDINTLKSNIAMKQHEINEVSKRIEKKKEENNKMEKDLQIMEETILNKEKEVQTIEEQSKILREKGIEFEKILGPMMEKPL